MLERAARLLEAFREGGPELTLAELVARSGVPRATAHRLAGQLVALGFLERSRRGWRLGTRLFELGQIVPRQQQLRELALPYMEDLYEVTRETVQLGILDQGEVLYVEIIAGHRRVSTPSRRGGRMPAHCTGLGKALLAFSPDVGREWLARGTPLVGRTPSTIVDPVPLARELQDVRRTGIAYDREEASVGLVCLAAPILGRDGIARAALSVSMPADGPVSPPQVAPAVRAGARALSRELARTPGG